jgi:hypothetical protein
MQQLGPPDPLDTAKQRLLYQHVLDNIIFFDHVQIGDGGQATVHLTGLREPTQLAQAAIFLAAAVGSTEGSITQFLLEHLGQYVYKRFKPLTEPGMAADLLAQMTVAAQLSAAILRCNKLAAAKGE